MGIVFEKETKKMKKTDMRALRKVARENRISVFKQGNEWIAQSWSDAYNAYVTYPLHYSVVSERAALQEILEHAGLGRYDYQPGGKMVFFLTIP